MAVLSLPIITATAPESKTAAHRAEFYKWWILPLAIANWIMADARERRRALCYDYDAFQFWVWPFLAPVYLVQTRGWRAAYPAFAFLLIWIIAIVEGVLLQFFFQKG
jgi:hypothetical protein